MTHKKTPQQATKGWLQMLPKRVAENARRKDFLTNQSLEISGKQLDLFARFFPLCNTSKKAMQNGLTKLTGVSLLAHPLQTTLLTFKSVTL